MKRLLLIAVFLLGVSPVYATCVDYTDGSAGIAAPTAVLCYKGKCDYTKIKSSLF
jgi:hypothetical protein